jgi:hypothetical protein
MAKYEVSLVEVEKQAGNTHGERDEVDARKDRCVTQR